MTRRVPASMRTRESLSDLIEGRLSSADGRAALVKLATRLIVEEALEAESRDALGRDYYEHGASPGQGWRNGVRMGRLKTAEGLVDYAAPQIAGREEPFRSEIRESLKGRTQALEDLAVERRSVTLRRHRGAVLSTGEGIADGLGTFAENISTREYQDKQGTKRQAVEVVVAGAQGMVNVLSPKADGADDAGGGGDEAA